MRRGVFHRSVDENRTEQVNNAMHWAYGTSCEVYGLAQGTVHARAARHGLAIGTLVWGASRVHLPAMKLAPPGNMRRQRCRGGVGASTGLLPLSG